ncbi:hypothetical protein [Streptomyces sp. NBC_01439]|uniref:hypothetical protein n=1 Tax=Streptomyces sp. NBC_01439 TaxID=2903867 RepID=UPI002E2BDA2D|nr:hypothetical protein [Streptomyces sp. NBC_01439]
MDGPHVRVHRAQIREHLVFRECSAAEAETLTAYLAEHVAHKERRPEQVRLELLARCRAESIEPPTPGRCDRISTDDAGSAGGDAEAAGCPSA